MSELKEQCGVFGIFGDDEAAYKTYLGLYALQHRGEESCGIATFDGERLHCVRKMGHVQDVFNEHRIKRLHGKNAIGHVRYSTSGSSLAKNAQPILMDYSKGEVAVAHNGNLVNAELLRSELEAYGAIFQTTTDSEIVIHLMAKPTLRNVEEGVLHALNRIEGAYCFVFLTRDFVIGARDPYGFRPLWLGRTRAGAFVLASETCALDLVDAESLRELEPGEVVLISREGLRSLHVAKKPERRAQCVFEHVYFSRPDSVIFGENVHQVRKKLGHELAREHPVVADIVIPVPDSGNSAALGFSEESGIPLEVGMVRNHYVGRTFIQPAQGIRDFKVKIKFNVLKNALQGKRVVVVDDSIVRGTTSRIRVKTLRQAGAKEVHLRVSCPPHLYPCAYGIDFPSREELLAYDKSVEDIRQFLECDSIGYLSLEGMLKCVRGPAGDYCTACWTGRYPVPFGKINKYFAEQLH